MIAEGGGMIEKNPRQISDWTCLNVKTTILLGAINAIDVKY